MHLSICAVEHKAPVCICAFAHLSISACVFAHFSICSISICSVVHLALVHCEHLKHLSICPFEHLFKCVLLAQLEHFRKYCISAFCPFVQYYFRIFAFLHFEHLTTFDLSTYIHTTSTWCCVLFEIEFPSSSPFLRLFRRSALGAWALRRAWHRFFLSR